MVNNIKKEREMSSCKEYYFIASNGEKQELTTKIIKAIRRNVVRNIEEHNYNKLSEKYKKTYSLKSWLDVQVIGRLFMIGFHENELWSEFYEKFYKISLATSYKILKNYDDASSAVIEQFCLFRNRRRYSKNMAIIEQRKVVDGLKEEYEEQERLATCELYDEKENYDNIINVVMPDIMKRIEKESKYLEVLEVREERSESEKLKEYNGMTYEEIYAIEEQEIHILSDKDHSHFRPDTPIAGYINRSVINYAIQVYNKRKNDKIVIASRLQKNGASGDEQLTEDSIMDIASSKRETNIFEFSFDDDFDSSKIGEESEELIDESNIFDEEDYRFAQMIHSSDDAMIKRSRELCMMSGENALILIDFIFNGMNQEQIREKYNLHTVGAIKSRVSRTRMKIREQLYKEKETEEILEKLRANGTITNYYKGDLCKVKEIIGVKNGMKDGKHVRYNEDGSKEFEKNYKNGILDGSFSIFYSNGNIKLKGQYSNGKKIGLWKRGSEKRVIEEEIFYYDNEYYMYTFYDEMGKFEKCGVCKEDGEIICETSNEKSEIMNEIHNIHENLTKD